MFARSVALQRLITLGIKYGPVAYEGIRRGKGPAQEIAHKQVVRRNARGIAVEHAEHLLDGSVLPVYDGDMRVWVVFSGDAPVGTHPVVSTPMESLLEHYDLGKRQRPEEIRAAHRRQLRLRKDQRDAGAN